MASLTNEDCRSANHSKGVPTLLANESNPSATCPDLVLDNSVSATARVIEHTAIKMYMFTLVALRVCIVL
ncbi:MAG: hypothetical protein AAFO91_03510, partial [Bacteroidota bacterium]